MTAPSHHDRISGSVDGTTAAETVFVGTFTDGVLDPSRPMCGPVRDGGHIVANTAPGCWGPMITPALRGGHEVTQPVAVDGARVGDAVAIRVCEMTITSLATASGVDRTFPDRFRGDPFVAADCPSCGEHNPQTETSGTGTGAVRCRSCGAPASPFRIDHGYTIVFDDVRSVGVTVSGEQAEKLARQARHYAALPDGSCQNPALILAPHDMVGVMTRLRPFLGQLGTTPAVAMPDSHNAGDFGRFLVDAPHDLALTSEQLQNRTDGHMDIDAVRTGAVVICPVKVDGAGVYLGDMHAMQGDGEIAGHTCDVAGITTLQVRVLKGLNIDGPLLLPVEEDLPFLARPFTAAERAQAERLAKQYGLSQVEQTLPLSVIGTGPDLNAATDNGLQRAADLLGLSVEEIRNRATISGAIEIGRHPGVVQVTFLAPVERLEAAGLRELAEQQYAETGARPKS